MFRNAPECSGVFHVPCFIDAHFHVTCPRLHPNDGITPRRLACTSPEETVAIYNKLLVVIYTDVTNITKRIFPRD